MEKILGQETFVFNVKLGTTIKIKKAFNKPFNDVIGGLDKMDIEDLIKLLYCGIDNTVHTKEQFMDAVLDNVGLMDLYDLVQEFIKRMQYPTLTLEEIDAKLEGKQSKNK